MARKLMTAALILTLALTAAGCGTKNAGASARNWVDGYDRYYETTDDGHYTADNQGRVQGYDARTNDTGRDVTDDIKNAGRDAANDAKNAGRDVANGMKNAARNIGDATEDTLDDMTNAAKKSSQQLTKNT